MGWRTITTATTRKQATKIMNQALRNMEKEQGGGSASVVKLRAGWTVRQWFPESRKRN